MMLIRLATLSSILFLLTTCYFKPNIHREPMKIRLAVCDDPEIADLDLQDIISVESSTELDLTDRVQAERDHKLHFSLTSKNRYHSSHFLHFREDQEVINWNIRHELMREISKYPFQFEIDSLQISVLKTEAIVPYFDGKEMVMNSKQRADSYQSGTNLRIQAVGPSRVSLEIAYACYSAGQVLKNT